MKKAKPPKSRPFPAAKQRQLDRLLVKNSEGKIAPSERVALEAIVAEAEEWMIATVKRFEEFTKSESP